MSTLAARLRALIRLEPAADIRWTRLAIGLWCVVFLSIAGYSIAWVTRHGTENIKHTVSPVYWKAAHQWWQGVDMYGSKENTLQGLHGFLYFPQAAIVFTPLAYLPVLAAEILWRLISLASVAWALWRMCGIFAGERRLLWFGLGTFLAMPATLLSSQNGQCNLLILALLALGAADMIQNRLWCSTFWLVLGLALKPHALVFILLIAVLQPSMRWRLLVGILAVAALPWVNPNWTYVWQEHISFVQKMRVAGRPAPGDEEDLCALLWSLGHTLSDRVWLIIRLVGAGTISLLALLATRRFARSVSIFYVFTLAIQYIMIFNPRTEGPTHAMMAIPLAIFTMQELTTNRRAISWALVAVCVLLGTSHTLIHPINRWMQPMLELWMAVYVASHILRGRSPLAAPTPSAHNAAPVHREEAITPA
jgi:hypothetical protein